MSVLNNIIQGIQESATFKVKNKALARRAAGLPVFDLSTGEPEFKMPEHISDSIYSALKAGKTKYTAIAGIPELRNALAAEVKRKTGQEYNAEREIIVTNGGKQGLFSACACLLEEGDEVLIPIPYWVSYPQMVKLTGATPVFVAPEENLKLSAAKLKAAITHRTKILILNSPSNPSGAVYTFDELKALGAVIRGTDVIVLWDAVYDEVFFNGASAPEWLLANPDLAEQTVYINSFSKTFAMTGLRVGYVAAHAELVGALLKHQNQSTSNVCTPAQYGALAALSGSRDFIREWAASYKARSELFVNSLLRIPGVKVPCKPDGAFYVLADVAQLIEARSDFNTAEDLAAELIEKTGIAAVPGDAFGVPWMLRFSLTMPEAQVAQVLELFENYCVAKR
jgi:aspartate aminotransferase